MLTNSFTSEEHKEDEDLKCPKCFSFFSSITKPYILPCNHNICLNCIDSLISENNNKCPICNYKFNKQERNSFKVNFGFLNIVIKILQTKIIFCTKCNKIFYWKEHFQSCEQKYFENCDNIFEDIKMNYEEGGKILKLIKSDIKLLNKCKIQIFNLIKNIVNEIHKKCKDNIDNKIKNELLNTNININFNKSKIEIIDFLKLCLNYPEYFNIKEIMQILRNMEKKELKFKKYGNYLKKSSFSPPLYHKFILPNKRPNDIGKENKKSETIENSSSIKIKNINFLKYNTFNQNFKSLNQEHSTIHYSKRNQKDIISEEENDNEESDEYTINNNCQDDEGINESDRIKVKTYHNNNISQFKKMNDNIHQSITRNKKRLRQNYLFKSEKQTHKKSKLKMLEKEKKNKYNINSLLNGEINIGEEQTKNKIIVGLKDVKVISLKSTTIHNSSLEKKGKKSSILLKTNYKIPEKKLKIEKMNYLIKDSTNGINKIYNIKDNNENSKTIQIETPSLSLLRSTDYSKRDFRMQFPQPNMNIYKNKLNNSLGYNFVSNTINVDQSINENLSIRKIGNYSKNINNNALKIIKNFNKIKDITNKLKRYFELINFLINDINKNVENNMNIMKNIIINNYNLLLNEISYNISHSQKNYLLTYINNTYNILIYDPFNRKYTIKNMGQIFKKNRINIQKFNYSTSIVYDDNDFIFISGGINNYNLFIILTWSTGRIFHIEYMQTKKAFHKTIFFNDKLYLIGGMAPDKKVSSECFLFSLRDKKWHLMPNLNSPRKNSSLCFYNNSILYVFRGEDDHNILDTIEYIDINKNKSWNIFKPIDYGYIWHPAKNSLVLTVDRDKIIICGGENKEGLLFKDCFLFEPSTQCVYRGLDLVTPSAFNSEGCFYQNELFGIDYKNKTQNNNRIIHLCNSKNNCWKFSYIK